MTKNFWDCECDGEEWEYVHSAAESKCRFCGAERDDQPDSREDEVWSTYDIDGVFIVEHPWNIVIRSGVMAEWVDCGEGLMGEYNPWGEYNPDDPNDVELLRFYVSYYDSDGLLCTPPDSTYCTLMPVSATPRERRLGLERILDEIDGHFPNGSYERILERMSRMQPEWFSDRAQLGIPGLEEQK